MRRMTTLALDECSSYVPSRLMVRFSPDHLESYALRVLEDAVEQNRTGPSRSWGTRFALAYLANSRDDRAPFDWLWLSLGEANDIVRGQNVHASLNALYRACGRERA
jgi:hypothetical protein